jgi:pyruvate ferredoxin oxidoreductase delta subunit
MKVKNLLTTPNVSSKKKKDSEYVIPLNVPTEGEAGETGTWRALRPVLIPEKCIGCFNCWLYCPEVAIKKTNPIEIDLRFCKGCGICAHECPMKAIKMIKEEEE